MENSYGISAVDYLQRAIDSRKMVTPSTYEFLFYSTLELRCCIERFFFEYLVLVGPEHIDKRIESLWRAKDLKIELQKIEPEFILKLQFLNILLKVHSFNENRIPDLDKLNVFYGKLGNYLHAQKKEKMCDIEDNWWNQYFSIIDEVIGYLHYLLSKERGHLKLNEYGAKFFEMYKSKNFSDDKLIEIIRNSSQTPR